MDTTNRCLEIGLSTLQKTLDGTALELVDNQKENLVGRKKLAEQTRGELPLDVFTPRTAQMQGSHAHNMKSSRSSQTTLKSSTRSNLS